MTRLNCLILAFTLVSTGFQSASGQELKSNYIGILTSILAEPYDSINAIEINVFPVVYEYRFGEDRSFALQLRPVINYRMLKNGSGISQTGATLFINKYVNGLWSNAKGITPFVGVYSTYTYNQLDKFPTLTLGVEPGTRFTLSEKFTVSVSFQPGINYYPDERSRVYVKARNGFKSHFGVIAHIGLNF